MKLLKSYIKYYNARENDRNIESILNNAIMQYNRRNMTVDAKMCRTTTYPRWRKLANRRTSYNYLLCEDLENIDPYDFLQFYKRILYVGKGCSTRCFRHLEHTKGDLMGGVYGKWGAKERMIWKNWKRGKTGI